jgi:hypothetical protein
MNTKIFITINYVLQKIFPFYETKRLNPPRNFLTNKTVF